MRPAFRAVRGTRKVEDGPALPTVFEDGLDIETLRVVDPALDLGNPGHLALHRKADPVGPVAGSHLLE
jgi:hypothetical protein